MTLPCLHFLFRAFVCFAPLHCLRGEGYNFTLPSTKKEILAHNKPTCLVWLKVFPRKEHSDDVLFDNLLWLVWSNQVNGPGDDDSRELCVSFTTCSSGFAWYFMLKLAFFSLSLGAFFVSSLYLLTAFVNVHLIIFLTSLCVVFARLSNGNQYVDSPSRLLRWGSHGALVNYENNQPLKYLM